LLLLLAVGCQPVNVEKNISIKAGEVRSLGLTAPSRSQKVKVTITPTGGPIDAYIVKDPDGKYGDNPPLNKPPTADVLASKMSSTEEFTLEATVPARTGYAVLLHANKQAEVKIKLVGR
jgi:hypothetical protein